MQDEQTAPLIVYLHEKKVCFSLKFIAVDVHVIVHVCQYVCAYAAWIRTNEHVYV